MEAWNGNGRYTYDRIGRGTIDIDAACVSMIGTIQPSRLAEYVNGAVRGGSGDDAAAVHSDVTAGRALAKKILDGSLADGFTVKDVYRPGWSGLTTSEEAQAAIELLVDLDWLAVAEIPTGGRKRTEHRINPRFPKKHPGKELPELPKDPFGSFGSTQGEGL